MISTIYLGVITGYGEMLRGKTPGITRTGAGSVVLAAAGGWTHATALAFGRKRS
jgi:hypothetical protein